MPVSTISRGRTRQMISCMATRSCGNWMTGRPIQLKLYEYLNRPASRSQNPAKRPQVGIGTQLPDVVLHFAAEAFDFAHAAFPSVELVKNRAG